MITAPGFGSAWKVCLLDCPIAIRNSSHDSHREHLVQFAEIVRIIASRQGHISLLVCFSSETTYAFQ